MFMLCDLMVNYLSLLLCSDVYGITDIQLRMAKVNMGLQSFGEEKPGPPDVNET
ncbi:hypothetical protein STEG23_031858, partial [Scotinomys teguina]